MDGKVGQSAEWTTSRLMRMIVKAYEGSNGVSLTFANTAMVTAPALISKTRAKTAEAVLPYADVLAHGSCSLWFQERLAAITALVWTILASVLVLAGRTPRRGV
jgi:hypothetical protein